MLALAPHDARAFACRGNALLQLARYDKALDSYARALDLAPGAIDIECNRGTALRFLKR